MSLFGMALIVSSFLPLYTREMPQPLPDPVFTFRGESGFTCVNFYESSGQECLLSSTSDGSVSLWDLKTFTLSKTWKAHPSSCHWVDTWKLKGQIVTQGRQDGCQLKLWDVDRERDVFSIELKYMGYCRCVIEEDMVAVPGGNASEVILFDLKSGEKIACLRPSQNMGLTMGMHWMNAGSEGNLIVCYEDGNVLAWNIKKQEAISDCKLDGDTPMGITWHQNRGFVSTSGNEQHLLEQDNGLIKVKHSIDLKNSGSSSCAVRSDGRILALGGWDSRIRLFSWKSMKPLAVLMYHSKTVENVRFSPSPLSSWKGKYALACAAGDKMISLWDLYNT